MKKLIDKFELWFGTLRFYFGGFAFPFAVVLVVLVTLYVVQKILYIP